MATKAKLLKLIHLNCSECMGGPIATENVWPISNMEDVENCTASECGFFEYRFGKDPVKSKKRAENCKRMIAQSIIGYKKKDQV